jgi:hypothetical protein
MLGNKFNRSRDSDGLLAGWLGLESRQEQDFSFLYNIQTGSRATQPPLQRVRVAIHRS